MLQWNDDNLIWSKGKNIRGYFQYRVVLNLILEDIKLITWMNKAQYIQASVRATSEKTFTVKDVGRQMVKIGGHLTCSVFGVAPKLARRMVLGTAIINKNRDKKSTNRAKRWSCNCNRWKFWKRKHSTDWEWYRDAGHQIIHDESANMKCSRKENHSV